jgi:hypothetical protein
MIAELTKQYPGVFCSRCREPIPVTTKLQDFQDDQMEDANAPHTFTARCRLCEYESVYAVRDIRKFDGKPRTRKSRQAFAGG